MRSSKSLFRFTLFLTLGLWVYTLLCLPTFDFDESLYRRIVEAMKASQNPWNLTWDGDPLYHKPPIFYWLIWASSLIVDGTNAGVSSFAARIPSFFSSIGILISLYFGTAYVLGKRNESAMRASVLAFCASLFPMVTATSVVFDPLQTLVLLPSLLIPAKFFYRGSPLSLKELFFFGGSLFLGCAVKGLNGIIVPSFAFGLGILFFLTRHDFKLALKTGFRFLGMSFIPGTLLTSLFYFLLDRKIGPRFTHEFLWVQHFERSQSAMEDHTGSFLYHPLVILFGGGFLTPFLIYLLLRAKRKFSGMDFPLLYAFSFIFIFSFSATKLPHYTWPVWPALALWIGLRSAHENDSTEHEVNRRIGFLASVPVFFIGVISFFLVSPLDFIIQTLPPSPAISGILLHFEGFGVFQKTALFSAGTLALIFQIQRKKITRSLPLTASMASTSALLLILALAPVAKSLLITPFFEIAEDLKAAHPLPSDCIRYAGALSPTLSLALGNELTHNRCETATKKFLIAPTWKQSECKENQMPIIAKRSYLALCTKL